YVNRQKFRLKSQVVGTPNADTFGFNNELPILKVPFHCGNYSKYFHIPLITKPLCKIISTYTLDNRIRMRKNHRYYIFTLQPDLVNSTHYDSELLNLEARSVRQQTRFCVPIRPRPDPIIESFEK